MDPQQAPVTPTRDRAPVIEQIASTPGNRGSGGNAQADVRSTQDDYAPFLEEDVANERGLSVELFLREILHVPSEWGTARMRKLATTQAFRLKLDDYKKDVKREVDLYKPFVELANFCLEKFGMKDRLQFCRNDPTIIRGSQAKRKPDVVNVRTAALGIKERGGKPEHMHDGGPTTGGAFHWRELRSFWEFKVKEDTVDTSTVEAPATNPAKANSKQRAEPKEPTRPSIPRTGKALSNPLGSAGNKRASEDSGSLGLSAKRLKAENIDPKLQCASYALELLSNGGLRSHVIAVLVSRNSLELLYYDRSLVLKSHPLDFTEDTTSFLAILFGFGQLTSPQWGDPAPTLLEGPRVATFADNYEAMYFGYVLTLSKGWQLRLENVIFRAHGIIGRGTVVVGADVVTSPLPNLVGKRVVVKWSWVATTRKEEGYIVKKAVEYADANRPSMRHHLPNIYHYEELPEHTPKCQEFLLANFKEAYEERVLRIVVQEELHPITDLMDATELAEAFKEIFECYRWLYQGPKIMHRDVSISNLMFQRIDGKLYGVLNDFDLAAFHDGSVASTSKQRTGTKPFMARDLLEHPPPRHFYRHDLESFLYVLAFLTCDTSAPGSTLGTWIDLGMAALQDAKDSVLTIKRFPPQKPAFNGFRVWIVLLRQLFSEGMTKRSSHQDMKVLEDDASMDFVHETLDGSVTFATFAAVLEKPLLPA